MGMRRGRPAAATLAAVAGFVLAMAGLPAVTAVVTDPTSTIDGLRSERGERSITYVATYRDRSDLDTLGIGNAGSWFPQFDAAEPVSAAPTGHNVRDRLPTWVGAFNHTTSPVDPGCSEPDALVRGCLPSYNFRTFSQDGPARSAGGHEDWATLRLPGGECGTAGAIVDPKTFSPSQEYPDPTGVVLPADGQPEPTNNNTMNRIQLQDGVPDTFFIGVVTDATGGEHDPGVVEIRGNVGIVDQREELASTQIEASSRPTTDDLAANGTPDVHVFRVDHFRSGDYLKLRLRGITSAASFSGLVFDDVLRTSTGRRAPARCDRPAALS